MTNIINDYRPTKLSEVIGQPNVIKSLNSLAKKGSMPQAFLLHGPSGTGKTTVARIIANLLGATGLNLIELDAATYSGVENVRRLTERQHYKPMDGKSQVTVIDECQALSSASWKALLKPIEDAPEHFYWIFCTTDFPKVPKTIKTRCHAYAFKEVPRDELMDLIEDIAEEENIDLPVGALDIIVQASEGSPRQALSYLSVCGEAETLKEIQSILREGYQNAEVIDLCRYLLFDKKPTLEGAVEIVNKFKDEVQAESVRLVILNYCTVVFLKPKGKVNREKLLSVMEEFSQPFFQAEKMAPIAIALGRLFYEDR